MRTEPKRIVIDVPLTVDYQFDDTTDKDRPHVVCWNGYTESGRTIEDAGIALGVKMRLSA